MLDVVGEKLENLGLCPKEARAGNGITSLIVSRPVSTIASRSMPRPSPRSAACRTRAPPRSPGHRARLRLLRLLGEPGRLLVGVVDLRERVAELHPADEVLEPLDDRRVVVRRAGEGRELERVVVEDRRLDERRLDEQAQRMVDELRPAPVGRGVDVALGQAAP